LALRGIYPSVKTDGNQGNIGQIHAGPFLGHILKKQQLGQSAPIGGYRFVEITTA